MEKKDEFFSLLVFKDITARHSGKYTCYATNSAAKVNYTAELFVKGESRVCNHDLLMGFD
jgi:Down syndrome cell adhesion molecule